MPLRARYLASQIQRDLAKKMVLLAGPRQVGKTTLALSLEGAADGYLSWDAPEDRERILRRRLPESDLWVFDELHKYRRWRNFLKGLSDKRPPGQRILVTGSGRRVWPRCWRSADFPSPSLGARTSTPGAGRATIARDWFAKTW